MDEKVMEEESDVVELCAILQCLGYNIRSLETGETNQSQVGIGKTVVIHCQSSGLHAVLETPNLSCSCPVNNQEGGSGFWQIAAFSGGRQHDKEFGSSLLGSLPITFREKITSELQEIVRNIKLEKHKDQQCKDDQCKSEQCKDDDGHNKSVSMVELSTTPEKNNNNCFITKPDTPSRYRSLDALTNSKAECDLPPPRLLANRTPISDSTESIIAKPRLGAYSAMSLRRQSTRQSIATPPGSIRKINLTSSPCQPAKPILERLITTEKMAVDLCQELSSLIAEMTDGGKDDSSISSLNLDVSKISLKGTEALKNQYASSPNLSGTTPNHERKPNLNRIGSASASNLTITKDTPPCGIKGKLRKLSPSYFVNRKEGLAKSETKSKLSGIIRPRIVTPVRVPNQSAGSSPNLSARNKFSHVKSTIPRINKK